MILRGLEMQNTLFLKQDYFFVQQYDGRFWSKQLLWKLPLEQTHTQWAQPHFIHVCTLADMVFKLQKCLLLHWSPAVWAKSVSLFSVTFTFLKSDPVVFASYYDGLNNYRFSENLIAKSRVLFTQLNFRHQVQKI